VPTPSKFRAATRARVIELLASGHSRAAAARGASIDPATLSRWVEKGRNGEPEGRWRLFADLVELAESRQQQPVLVALQNEFDWERDPSLAMKFLERAGEFTPPEPIKVEVTFAPFSRSKEETMIDRARVKTATVPEWVAVDLLRDIDSAIRHRDSAQLRNFAYEAERSGMDQEAARCREIAEIIETKAAAAGRDEVIRLKAALRPPEPTQRDLAARYDQEQLTAAMNRQPSFSVNDFETQEAHRVAVQNELLRERQRQLEEQRAEMVAQASRPRGPER
jgi:hypothetical protein